ncbi:MAG: hypothetical protein AAGA06_01285 [Pseudomonadota bacterium]
MTTKLLTLIITHFACSDIAAVRPLSQNEVLYCSAIYQEIKLAFVPGVDPKSYASLPLAEQHGVNKEGYLAFRAWRIDNPETVEHLERVARGEAKLGVES